MNHIATNQDLEEEDLPIQEFIFNSKDLLVADQLFYKIGLDMKINPFSENYLKTFKEKTIIHVEDCDGSPDPHVEIKFLTLNPKQFHTIKTALKNPLSENFFESEVTQVSLVKEGVDCDGRIMRESPFYEKVWCTDHRDIIFKIILTNNEAIENFSAFLGLEAMRKSVRGALYNGYLIPYHGQSYNMIATTEWAQDAYWHEFLAHGCHKGHRVFFYKKELYEWLCMNEVRPYVMHPSWLEILPHKYLRSHQGGLQEPEKRAAFRLFTLCQKEIENGGVNTLGKKHELTVFIEDLAKKNGFEITSDIQERLSNLSEEGKDQLDKTAVSREDIKAIATLLRSIKQQGGRSFKK